MFHYATSYLESLTQLEHQIQKLRDKGYTISSSKTNQRVDESIHKYTIMKSPHPNHHLVFTIGLHGIEGYVGHAAIQTFLQTIVQQINPATKITIYFPLNPFGMIRFHRTNQLNIDLNRNYLNDFEHKTQVQYHIIQDLFSPKRLVSIINANLSFYGTLIQKITKHGIKRLSNAILTGQSVDAKGLYFTGNEYTKESLYIIKEIENTVRSNLNTVWIDIHTGFGPKNQMSIINSRFEHEETKIMMSSIEYPAILGLNDNDIYDTSGDITEMIYQIKNVHAPESKLYATCFEFGTKGISILSQINSLKALYFDNHLFHIAQSKKITLYTQKLMKKLFMPSSKKWREKAEIDFTNALIDILKYKGLMIS